MEWRTELSFFLVNSQRGLKLMEQKCGVADSDVLLVITCGVPVVTSGIPVVFQWYSSGIPVVTNGTQVDSI